MTQIVFDAWDNLKVAISTRKMWPIRYLFILLRRSLKLFVCCSLVAISQVWELWSSVCLVLKDFSFCSLFLSQFLSNVQ